ncbi:MAG TPA: DUF3617 family protein [Caulobacteraceae bacterium]|nr:DUF3617 family protein [Caulobacteraceae bacterium]
MGRLLAVAMGALGAFLFARPAAATETILPGYWESVNRVIYPLPSEKTDRRCITPKDIAKFLRGPQNHIYHCVYPVQEASGGHIRFSGVCVDKKGHAARIRGEGAYTPTTLQMTARGSFKALGIPIPFAASTQAHRIGDQCPSPPAAPPS